LREIATPFSFFPRAASPFPLRRPFISPAPPTKWKTNAVVLQNECVRFSKRLRSFSENSASLGKRRGGASETKGRRGRNERAARVEWKGGGVKPAPVRARVRVHYIICVRAAACLRFFCIKVEKSLGKVWRGGKNVVPLHSLSEREWDYMGKAWGRVRIF